MADLKDDIETVRRALPMTMRDESDNPSRAALTRIASAVGELEHLRSRIEALPELFDMSTFVRAGLSFSDASTALMVSRRILENAERAEEERVRKAAAEPRKLTPQQLMELPETGQCEKVCDHGSRCFLPNNHLPRGRHESDHGCIFYDTTPELEAKLAEVRRAKGKPNE